jgi:teichoic acid transport system permease protein
VADVSAPPAGLIPLGGRPRVRDYLRWMWSRREFAYHLASGQLRGQNMDTLLGNFWQLINPILLIGVYYLVFGILFGQLGGDALPWRPANYIGFLSVGVFIYSYQQRAITAGASSIVGNLGLIRSLQFPRAVLPASTVIKEVLGFGSSLFVMTLVMLATGEPLTWSWLWFPLVFVLATMFAFGGSLITARLTEAVRDTRNLLPFVFRLLFYVSGVLYDITRFTADYPNWSFLDELFLLNPFYVYVSLVRESIMASYVHTNPVLLWVAGITWAVVALVAGLWYFIGAEKKYGRG